MQSDSGQFAIEIIKSIIVSDINSGGRLRLLSIYTGEHVTAVITKLNNELKKTYRSVIKMMIVFLLKITMHSNNGV